MRLAKLPAQEEVEGQKQAVTLDGFHKSCTDQNSSALDENETLSFIFQLWLVQMFMMGSELCDENEKRWREMLRMVLTMFQSGLPTVFRKSWILWSLRN